jgi:hypothetical protein
MTSHTGHQIYDVSAVWTFSWRLDWCSAQFSGLTGDCVLSVGDRVATDDWHCGIVYTNSGRSLSVGTHAVSANCSTLPFDFDGCGTGLGGLQTSVQTGNREGGYKVGIFPGANTARSTAICVKHSAGDESDVCRHCRRLTLLFTV